MNDEHSKTGSQHSAGVWMFSRMAGPQEPQHSGRRRQVFAVRVYSRMNFEIAVQDHGWKSSEHPLGLRVILVWHCA